MNQFYSSKLALLITIVFLTACHQNKYSDEQRPTKKPSISDYTIEDLLKKVFSPIPNVRDFTMSKTKTEIYLTVESYKKQSSSIIRIFEKEGVIEKETASFSGQFKDLESALSPDNLKLYFASNRPIHPDSTNAKDMDIWMVERNSLNEAWSNPKNLGVIINTTGEEFYPSIAENGNLYFTAEREDSKGKEDIYVSRLEEGTYSIPISLSDSINTSGYEFNAFIAPDESYLLFSGYNRADGFGSADLYISHQDKNGNWSKASNLGASVNTKFLDYCPFVDVANDILYFTSERNKFKQGLVKQDLDQYLIDITQYQNGLSRIYAVPFKNK